MQLLIVHHDPEVGEPLVQMVKEYTEHNCGFATSNARALDWARGVTRCSLLITQLEGEGIDGLELGGSLSESFAGLQTMFLPAYDAAEQRLDVPRTKVFPEPIDGERLLNAITRAEEQRQTGMDLYHALDVLQMCCLSRRSGAVQLVKGSKTAVVYLRNGDIVHAERGTARGADAVYEIVPWEAVEFAYDQTVRAPIPTINTPWAETIITAVGRRKSQVVGSGSAAGASTAAPPPPEPPKPARRGLFGGSGKLRLFALLSACATFGA
jgi:CheY-like chemotaxis protein